jgi:hypothetical protein
MKHLIGLLLLATSACTQVTATVTSPAAPGPARPRVAQVVPDGYKVYLRNNKTGSDFEWKLKAFDTLAICQTALGNANEVLASVSDPNPDVKVKDWEQIVPELARDLDAVMLRMFQSTGVLPDLSVFCKLKTDA